MGILTPPNGGPINIMLPCYKGIENVKVQLFTVAFRKVQEKY
jgi:hypothetical protein